MTVNFRLSLLGARPAEPGHNRSSSPGAALADGAERKAAKHRSRANPTFDQKT